MIGIATRAAAAVLIWAAGTPAAGAQTSATVESYELRIEADEVRGRIEVRAEGIESAASFRTDEVATRGDALTFGDDLRITAAGLEAGGHLFPLDGLRIDDLYREDEVLHLTLRRRPADKTAERIGVERNRIAALRTLRVEEDDYVRGDVIALGGDIYVAGEVNHDVVALWGDVRILSEGRVGGDAAALAGRVVLRGDGRVRGRILTPHESRRRLGWRDEDDADELVTEWIHYNRVDGLHLGAVLRATDPDSVLPTLIAGGGHAFVAERWRYEVGARQRFGDEWAVALGGGYFRRTATDDEWVAPDDENSAFAFLAAEDYRDYYQQEGGRVFFTAHPGRRGVLGVGYGYSELDWMDSHPKLFSLFGWDKEFRANFSSVPVEVRRARAAEFTAKLGELTAWGAFDTRDDAIDPICGWWGRIEYTRAGGELNGDLEYRRWIAELRRHQPLGHGIGIHARLRYGGSSGELPLMRQFYLGGLRTLRGLRHKSLRGEQMVLANLEYQFDLGLLETRTAIFFDAGAVGDQKQELLSDGDIAMSVGLRVGLDEGIYLDVAKSLDDTDEPVRVWLMLERTF